MNVLVVLGHPDEKSFNHAIAGRVVEELKNLGHVVLTHDLYRERFDPALSAHEIPRSAALEPTVARHCEELAAADGIVVIHPNWWGQPPAVLKGWVDRVIRPGVAYEFREGDQGEGVPVGLLKAKAAVIFNTSNTPRSRETAVFGDPLETLWKNCIFGLCGISTVHRRTFGVMVTSTAQERACWLDEAGRMIWDVFPKHGG